MSATVEVYRVPFVPEVWMVPATLADLECRHGELGCCPRCTAEAEQAAIADADELEQVPA